MNRIMRNVLCYMAIMAILLTINGCAFMKSEELRFVARMGNGINLGNSLDATNLWTYKPAAKELDYETFWGNPPIEKKHFQAIYQAGFQTVRIPVTWEDHLNSNGDISEVWMDRVQAVVDMALEEGLFVIIDTHHESWLDLQVKNETQIAEKLTKVWQQIAIRFKGYDERLLFEGMNEPRLRNSDVEWTAGTTEMRELVNRLNAVFIETVRSIEGNEKRYLLIGAYATSSFSEALESLTVSGEHLIVSVHMYSPYQFCQNDEGTDEWSELNAEDTKEIDEAFTQLNEKFIKKGMPVILTEFGCTNKQNLEARVDWMQYYAQSAKNYGIAYIWWDNGSDFALLDRDTGQWEQPEIVRILVGE